jgi:hypothetical protein
MSKNRMFVVRVIITLLLLSILVNEGINYYAKMFCSVIYAALYIVLRELED